MGVTLKVSSNGRLCIPADVRERLGLKGGGTVTLQETEDGLLLSTVEQRVRRAQALYREAMGSKPGTSVDQFLRERRATWGGDEDAAGDHAG